jgi:hypothetical protein
MLIVGRDFSGKQAAAGGARAAMVIVGPVVATVMLAPDRTLLTGAAEMNRLIVCVVAHLTPITLAQRADRLADVAHDNPTIDFFCYETHGIAPRKHYLLLNADEIVEVRPHTLVL